MVQCSVVPWQDCSSVVTTVQTSILISTTNEIIAFLEVFNIFYLIHWFPDNSAQDNSARTIRRWTIRRGQFGATIRLGQFGAKYDINFIESSAFIQQYPFHQSRFYFSKILFNNPAWYYTL